MLIKYNYDNIQISSLIHESMTGSRMNEISKKAEVEQTKSTKKDRKEPRLFEKISDFLIETLRGSGG